MMSKLGIEVKFSPPYHQATNGAIERAHLSIKNSLHAALVEVANEKRDRWMEYLPFILLGRRTAIQEDLNASPAQLLYGENVPIPGELDNPEQKLEDVQSLLNRIQKQTNKKAKPMSRHRKPDQEYMPDSTLSATHVYIKNQDRHSLEPRYSGPFLILDRPSKSTIKIKTGTHPDGSVREEVQHWQNARPAYVGADIPDANRPKLGRPPKPCPSPAASPTTLSDVNNVVDELPAISQEINQPESQQIEPPNSNVEPEIPPVSVPQPDIEPAGTPSSSQRPVRSNRMVPHPKFEDYETYSVWSNTLKQNLITMINAF